MKKIYFMNKRLATITKSRALAERMKLKCKIRVNTLIRFNLLKLRSVKNLKTRVMTLVTGTSNKHSTRYKFVKLIINVNQIGQLIKWHSQQLAPLSPNFT